MQDTIKYREYIEGFRGIAVLLVLFFHYFKLIPNGYIGVDFFFVISGFLVGGIVLEKHENHEFSFLTFYIKRINRIIPVLLFYIIIAVIFLFFLPIDFKVFHLYEIVASLISLSNFLYQSLSGYFDNAATYKLLLHTWSLGVEEQFYLVLPILISGLLFFGIKKKIQILLCVVIIAGSIVAVLLVKDENLTFFLLPFRFWEFIVGLLIFQTKKSKQISNNFLSILTIIFCVFILFFPADNYRSIFTVFSVLVFGLIFYCIEVKDKTNFIALLLKNNILLFVGKVSYSLYLSHWIVFYFMFNMINLKKQSFLGFLLYMVLSFLLSVFSYYLVEKKLRLKTDKMTRTILKQTIAVLFLVATIVGCSFSYLYILPYNKYHKMTKQKLDLNTFGGEVIIEELFISEKKPTVIFWGDSHVAQQKFPKEITNFNIVKIFQYGCPSLLNTFRKRTPGNSVNCLSPEDKSKIIKRIEDYSPEMVVLVNRYQMYAYGLKRKNKLVKITPHFLYHSDDQNNKEDERISSISLGLDDTIEWLLSLNIKVLLLSQTIEFSEYGFSRDLYSEGIYEISINDISSDYNKIESLLIQKTEKYENVYFFQTKNLFVKNGSLILFEEDNNRFIYMDDNHLTPYATLRIANPVFKKIEQIINF